MQRWRDERAMARAGVAGGGELRGLCASGRVSVDFYRAFGGGFYDFRDEAGVGGGGVAVDTVAGAGVDFAECAAGFLVGSEVETLCGRV